MKRLSPWIFYGLLAYMPLHIFLSTWLGTSFDVLEPAKVLKDVILVIGFGCALLPSLRQPWFKQLLKDRLVWLIMAYGVLTVGLALIKPTEADAEVLGVVYNLRFLVFFGYALLLTRLFNADRVRTASNRIVLGVATLVLFFGIVQYTFLPNDALSHVGYERKNGVLPAFFIDDKPDLERSMSTLRDPNSLGSYVIIIGALSAALLFARNVPKRLGTGILALSGLCLWFTFSRSAWLGFALAMAVFVGLRFGKQLGSKNYRRFVVAGIVLVLVGLGSLVALRNTYFVQNVIFHADESTVLEDPNELRTRFLRESVDDIAANPAGSGPGTAGLASIRNEKQGVRLNENYYLQIATEVGLLGLALFVAILGVVGWRLFKLSGTDPSVIALLASFAGLFFTNFLVHIWSNEAVAYTWWGLAGLYLMARPKLVSKNTTN